MSGNPLCSNFISLLSPFSDGELNGAERQSVERHLAGCSDCAGRLADLRASSGLLRMSLEQSADEVDFSGFSDRVMARLTPARPPLLERWRTALSEMLTYQRGALMAGAAAAVMLAVGTPLLLRGAGDPEGYASKQPLVRTVSTEATAHVAPVVIQADNGDSIIWLVNHEDHDRAQAEAATHSDSGSELKQTKPQGGAL